MNEPAPDTTDLRAGAPIHNRLLALLPLVGVWRGTGAGVVQSTGEQFRYGQQVRIAHDGRPFLAYESRSWLLDDDDSVRRQAWRESGFWRPGPGEDDIELVLASNTGQALVFAGRAGDQTWELETVSARHAPSAKDVDGERRLYAIRGGQLVYATDLAPGGQPYAPHLNGTLQR
ncbi:MAG TPA: FABP family protein [Jatrophihabitans sp.]|nr:FABP family protein [Jatrophihabitans sp.]